MALLFEQESNLVLGACFEVFKDKGSGYLESVYHECLKIEFGLRQIPFLSKPKLPLTYKGVTLDSTFEPDFICFDKIIMEIKAVTELNDIHRAKVLHYLHSSHCRVGYLINFHSHPKLQFERYVL